jgi:hypothetical protein
MPCPFPGYSLPNAGANEITNYLHPEVMPDLPGKESSIARSQPRAPRTKGIPRLSINPA